MRMVGLTGGIGAGKSAVAARLAALGAVVIDADRLAREVVEPGTPGLAAVVEAFGDGVLAADGRLDRAAMARRIFGDDAARATLEGIVHPLVRARTAEIVAAAPENAVVVNDVPLIVEKQMSRLYDTVVVVFASLPTRLDRLVRLRGMSEQEARARIAAQATDEQRREVADVAIVNDGTPKDLDAAVAAAWPAIAGQA
ncbi:dephospho-CoA kinase [Dactylosporangium aurantiacum]|uniref:Dephospho-CoA kinase n=1 Tax=Dactylosporangium aurantiacum TaxID=35754 RepID=A0A9Q9IGH9_9ACTN|nr:dephospho-CoA kinase [Dactylosporangium aurantiacum]